MRWILLLLFALAGWSEDANLGIGGASGQPVVPLGVQTSSPVDPLLASPNFNDLANAAAFPQTFTRATSSYDPQANVITAPGVLRTRPVYIGSHTYSASLIEGPRTNLLAAGSSDRLTVGWTNFNGPVVSGAATLPSGELADSFSDNSGNASHFIAQTIAKAASALPYSYQFMIQGRAGNTKPSVLINVDDSVGAGANVTFNLSTGVLGTPTNNNGFTLAAATAKPVGSWYFVTLTFTSNTGTSLRPTVFLNGAAVYVGDGTGGFNIGYQSLEQAAFPSSYISNRNLLTYSNVFSNAAWVKNASLTVAQTGGALPSGETGWTVTTATGSDSLIYNLTVTANTTYTASWWAKLGSTAAVRYTIWDTTHSAYITSPFNYAGSLNASTYTRVSFSFTTPAGCTAIQVIPITWTGVAGTALCGDVQTEYGTTPTAYWGTNATVGGRDADNLSVSLAGITDTRQNWFLYSEQLDNAAWNKQGGTVTANSTNDSQGNPYADTFVESAANVSNYFKPTALLATTDGATYTEVIEAKNAGRNILIAEVKDRTGGTIGTPSINLTTGVVTGSVPGGTVTTTALANGWWRIAITWPAGVGTSVARISWFLNLYGSYLGDGVSGIYFARHQFVQGTDPGPAAYLPTAGTAVTATQTGLSTTAGTLVALGVPYGWTGDQDGSTVWEVYRAEGQTTQFSRASATQVTFRRNPSSGVGFPQGAHGLTSGVLSSLAMTFDSGGFITGYVAGSFVGVGSGNSVPWLTATALTIGNNVTNGPRYFYGWVWLGYWHQTALSAAQNSYISTYAHR